MTIETLEKRADAPEREMQSISELLKLERQVRKLRFAAVLTELDLIKRRMDELPSVIARTVMELLDERDRRQN